MPIQALVSRRDVGERADDAVAIPEISPFRHPTKAANDDRTQWPLLPFPEGWNAAC
jgi:hypothetical protein